MIRLFSKCIELQRFHKYAPISNFTSYIIYDDNNLLLSGLNRGYDHDVNESFEFLITLNYPLFTMRSCSNPIFYTVWSNRYDG